MELVLLSSCPQVQIPSGNVRLKVPLKESALCTLTWDLGTRFVIVTRHLKNIENQSPLSTANWLRSSNSRDAFHCPSNAYFLCGTGNPCSRPSLRGLKRGCWLRLLKSGLPSRVPKNAACFSIHPGDIASLHQTCFEQRSFRTKLGRMSTAIAIRMGCPWVCPRLGSVAWRSKCHCFRCWVLAFLPRSDSLLWSTVRGCHLGNSPFANPLASF